VILLGQWSATASAHTSGTAGYSEISIRERTIDYGLLLDYDQLIGYLPIDSNGDGKISDKEFSQTELIKMFILDHITVSANGAVWEPEVVGVSAIKRNDLSLIQFEFRYSFQELIQSYEMDYHLYFDNYDPDHKNFATIQSGKSKNDKIFSKGNHVLKGTIENQVNPIQPLLTGDRSIYVYWTFLGATVLIVFVFLTVLKARKKSHV
jgi:hypothetical protein